LYCDHFVETKAWETRMRPAGRRVVHHMQARHDGFVSFEDGASVFQALVAENGLSVSRQPDGKRTIWAHVDDDNNAGDEHWGGHARFDTLLGGHVTGFLLAGCLLAPAVLQALRRLADSA
jgi:hypothetical protein